MKSNRRHTSNSLKEPLHSRSRIFLFLVCSLFILSISSGVAVIGNVGQLSRRQVRLLETKDEIWKKVESDTLAIRTEQAYPKAFQTYELNPEKLTKVLADVPMEFTEAASASQALIALPMPDGSFSKFRIEESPVMAAELEAQFPQIRSYRGQGIDDPTATARFDWTPFGLNAIVVSSSGTVFIEPYSQDDTQHYMSFFKEELTDGFNSPQCQVTDELAGDLARQLGGVQPMAAPVGTSLRTYRLAIATTVEYTNNSTYGGNKSSTLTKLNSIVNLINAIYEREVSIRFQLVSGELSIIFDAEPDGFTNGTVSTMLSQCPGVLNAAIGSSAYDIGHVFGLSGAGSSAGIAQVAVVCGASKGAGASILGIALVTGNFSIDSGLVAHEFGHQFSALHSFNSTSSGCNGNRSASAAFEPGSGSTIMAYPGICSPENLQNNADNYFHGGSFDSIANYAAGGGAPCASATSTGNNAPVVSAGPDFTIPMGTPFTLTALGSDPDGDPLTYCWEEMDLGTASPPMTDDGSRPLFRSLPPTTSQSRTFPKLSSILNNTSTIGETLPSTTRAMNFRVTARDNRAAGGGVGSDAMVLTVTSAAGPFLVTSPNTAVSWSGGSTQNVTWNVAGTSSVPVSCANVRISLSTDGGSTFPTLLADNTPNDGSQAIAVPNVSTSNARIKVEAIGNVFFDVSNANFTITAGTTPTQYQGFLDAAGCGIITGWAWDANQPNSVISVDIYDGATLVVTQQANLFREDILNAGIGNGFHGFSFTVPQSLKNGQAHSIKAQFHGTSTQLGNSPRTINCTGGAVNYQGYHDGAGCGTISGWAWDANDPNNPINVDIYDGGVLVATVPSIQFRPDLVTAGIGNGFHGFSFTVLSSMKDGQAHAITVKFPGTSTNLNNTPRTITCNGAAPVFQGEHEVANCSVISGWAWDANDPNSPINVAIFSDGQLIATVLAIQFRQDLVNMGIGNGYHAFVFNVPQSLKNGQTHSIRVRFSGTSTSLTNTPRSITCP
jgi:hypothetical protein